MPGSQAELMNSIEVHGLTKDYGATRAVDHLDFSVRPGRVTGFLGPNGAGKSTTMRLVLGLDRPTSGTATIGGGLHPPRQALAQRRRTARRTGGARFEDRAQPPGGAGHE